MTHLLLVAATLVAVLAAAGVGDGATWDVYPGAGTPIQDAVDGAGVGDAIYVHKGTYVENVDVDKQVTLIGDGADVVTVRAANVGDHVFGVTADYVKIGGFTVKGTTSNLKAGIHLCHADHCCISENNASNNDLGIWLFSSSNNTLTDNIANSNVLCGISLSSSSNNTLIGNAVSNNNYGIYLWHSSDNNTLHHNTLIDNTPNAYDDGTNQWDSGSEGNYYSDYTGTDTNRDGIGDTYHPIPCGGSIDQFPLMQPWTSDTSQKGDLNGDDRITPADAMIAVQIAVSGAHDNAADVSSDGRVTSLDVLMILQAAAGATEL